MNSGNSKTSNPHNPDYYSIFLDKINIKRIDKYVA